MPITNPGPRISQTSPLYTIGSTMTHQSENGLAHPAQQGTDFGQDNLFRHHDLKRQKVVFVVTDGNRINHKNGTLKCILINLPVYAYHACVASTEHMQYVCYYAVVSSLCLIVISGDEDAQNVPPCNHRTFLAMTCNGVQNGGHSSIIKPRTTVLKSIRDFGNEDSYDFGNIEPNKVQNYLWITRIYNPNSMMHWSLGED